MKTKYQKYQKIIAYVVLVTVIAFGFSRISNAQTFTEDLRVGSTGEQVTNLQTWLEENGYLTMPYGVSKGYFGQMTRSALSRYQSSINLPAYGFFGSMTREHFNRFGNGGGGSASALNVISPNGGENWQKGTYQEIKWNAPQYFRATNVNIKLLPIIPPCNMSLPCPAYSIMSYSIANNISANQRIYSWRVGDYIDPSTNIVNSRIIAPIPDGQYTVQICEVGTNVCDTSNRPFTISSVVTNTRAPVINGVDAPTTLAVGQTGTWTIRATDPQNGVLSYYVYWGDEVAYTTTGENMIAETSFIQNTKFTHSYSRAGTFTVTVVVRNGSRLSSRTSTTILVTDTTSNNQVRVLSPNGGERWNMNSVYRINWSNINMSYGSKVDLYLAPLVVCPAIYPTPSYCNPQPIVLDRNIDTNTIYNWIAGTDVVNNPIPTGDYRVKICVAGTENCDFSDQYFTLVSNSYGQLRICPSEKIINQMPTIYPNNNPPSTYFILNGTRRELAEFDLNWVSAYCSVREQVVY